MSRPVAFVTGAKRGIGRAIAEAFAAAGYDLVLADLRRDEEAEAACAAVARHGGQAAFEAFDIADLAAHEPALDRIQEKFGRLDCLVANAGIGAPVRGDPLDLEPDNFDAVMKVNLRGTVFLTQKAVRRMLAAPDPGGSPRRDPHLLGERGARHAGPGGLLHLQGGARHVDQDPGAAAGRDLASASMRSAPASSRPR